jgi:glutaredoxin 3
LSKHRKVTVYGNSSCPFCGAARMLLTKKGLEFQDIDITNDPLKREEMQQRSGRRTVPQIFIGDTHIGGFDELCALDMDGELDELLASSSAGQ